MIMKLKMCPTDKIFGKIYLKPIRDTFLQYVVCNQVRDGVNHEGKGEDVLVGRFRVPPSPSLSWKS